MSKQMIISWTDAVGVRHSRTMSKMPGPRIEMLFRDPAYEASINQIEHPSPAETLGVFVGMLVVGLIGLAIVVGAVELLRWVF